MSAPDTNLERQGQRHIGPLLGMGAVVVFALALLFWWLTHETATAPGPQGTTTEQVAPGIAPQATPPAVTAPPAATPPAVTPQMQAPGAATEGAAPTPPATEAPAPTAPTVTPTPAPGSEPSTGPDPSTHSAPPITPTPAPAN